MVQETQLNRLQVLVGKLSQEPIEDNHNAVKLQF